MELPQMKSSFSLKVYIYGFIAVSLWMVQFYLQHDRAQEGLRAHRGLEERVVAVAKHDPQNNVSRNLLQQSSANLSSKIANFEELVDMYLSKPNVHTDLEIVDVLEQFFWGKEDGIAMEIGIKSISHSMTSQLHRIGWKRILLEGDPSKWTETKKAAVDANVITAPICQRSQVLHYARYPESAAGILEFMSIDFMRAHHYRIFEATNPPGEVKSIGNWQRFPNVSSLECHPISLMLKSLNFHHINALILDASGAELSILKTIDWKDIQFDVICIENDPLFRPTFYTQQLISLLAEHSYLPYGGQQGRNKWFIREEFLPSRRFSQSQSLVFRGADASLLSHDASIPLRQLVT